MADNQDDGTTVEELKALVEQFRSERGWDKHHTLKNLAGSINIEAGELMEFFRWDEGHLERDRNDIAEEVADGIIGYLNFALTADIDVADAVRRKIQKNTAKYPVDTADDVISKLDKKQQ